jgi:hypothetical protein
MALVRAAASEQDAAIYLTAASRGCAVASCWRFTAERESDVESLDRSAFTSSSTSCHTASAGPTLKGPWLLRFRRLPTRRTGQSLSQTIKDALVVLHQLGEARLEILVLAPSIDVMIDGVAHSLRDGHAICASDRLKLSCLLLWKAHGESL